LCYIVKDFIVSVMTMLQDILLSTVSMFKMVRAKSLGILLYRVA